MLVIPRRKMFKMSILMRTAIKVTLLIRLMKIHQLINFRIHLHSLLEAIIIKYHIAVLWSLLGRKNKSSQKTLIRIMQGNPLSTLKTSITALTHHSVKIRTNSSITLITRRNFDVETARLPQLYIILMEEEIFAQLIV